MKNIQVDYTIELSNLLSFVSQVAVAIRMNTPYNAFYLSRNKEHAFTVMWLADSLHNLNVLSHSIQQQDPQKITLACNMLIEAYESYSQVIPNSRVQGNPVATFEQNQNYFNLSNAIEILNTIKAKATN